MGCSASASAARGSPALSGWTSPVSPAGESPPRRWPPGLGAGNERLSGRGGGTSVTHTATLIVPVARAEQARKSACVVELRGCACFLPPVAPDGGPISAGVLADTLHQT